MVSPHELRTWHRALPGVPESPRSHHKAPPLESLPQFIPLVSDSTPPLRFCWMSEAGPQKFQCQVSLSQDHCQWGSNLKSVILAIKLLSDGALVLSSPTTSFKSLSFVLCVYRSSAQPVCGPVVCSTVTSMVSGVLREGFGGDGEPGPRQAREQLALVAVSPCSSPRPPT